MALIPVCMNGALHLVSGRGAKGEQGPRGLTPVVQLKGCHVTGPNLHLRVTDAQGDHLLVASLAPLIEGLAGAIDEARALQNRRTA